MSDIVGDTRLRLGTLMHTDFERIFRGKPVMLEVNLTPFLPEGWAGTADHVIWNVERKAFVLSDLKTAKAEAMPWVLKEGVKDSHQHQLSAYWYALRKMGIPLIHGYGVLYLPITQDVREPVQPSWQEATPLDETYMQRLMAERWLETKEYLAAVGDASLPARGRQDARAVYLNDALAPVQEREFRTYWNKAASKAGGKETPGVEVKLVPNWSTTYCDYPDELCDCRHQRPEKIGTWLAGPEGVTFTFSRGKEETVEGDVCAFLTTHSPSVAQVKSLKEAYVASSS